MSKEYFIKKVEDIKKKNAAGSLSLIITVVQLPTGAKEVITNTEDLFEKVKYITDNYDENLSLKRCPSIKILDYIVL